MSQWHALIKNDPRWKAARADALDRDDHTCQVCGLTAAEALEPLQVDHVDDLARVMQAGEEWLAFDLDNLVTLCRPCHTAKGNRTEQLHRAEWISPEYRETLAAIL